MLRLNSPPKIECHCQPVSDGQEPRDEGEEEVDDPHDDDDGEAGEEHRELGVEHPKWEEGEIEISDTLESTKVDVHLVHSQQ